LVQQHLVQGLLQYVIPFFFIMAHVISNWCIFRAQAAGWNYVILSDQWHIREYSTNNALQPEPDAPLPAFGQPAQAHPFPQAQTFAPPPASQTFGSTQQQAPPLQIPQPLPPQPQQSFASPHHFNSTIAAAPQPQHAFPQQSFTPPSVQSTPPPAPPPTPQIVAPTPPPSERPPGLVSVEGI
jgi:hypothetical protein